MSVVLGSGSTSCGSGCSESWSGQRAGISWSYDNEAFHANAIESLADFIVVTNSTASYVITATASFLVTVTTCVTSTGPNGQSSTSCSASVTTTSVGASETVESTSFILNFQTRLANVTATNGLLTSGKELLRNSDGSFYRNDSFCDIWNATFKFASERTDIKVNISSVTPISLRILNFSSEPFGRSGSFCYVVAANSPYRPYNAVLLARALNWQGVTLGLREKAEPFAVVQYQPHFTYFTYMLYNSKNASTYGRPFVTLVRYGGNNPGYSYAGDANTAPITAGNDTRERAWIGQSFKPNTTYKIKGIGIAEKKTTPPPRYSEATLLAEMERQGIGTKSTRPLMIDTLKRRAYVRIQRHVVFPTERGVKFIASIEKPWGEYISPQFTARVETDMEQVAQGKKNWEELVDSERRSFAQAIHAFRIRP